MRVLVIPEDFRLDQYILEPIIKALLASAGRPHANVRVCLRPLLGSINQTMSWERISDIIDSYPLVDLFLLIVDRDSEEYRHTQLENIERQAALILPADRCLLAEDAWQEVEVWALAGCDDLPRAWQWKTVRAERDPKEKYFTPYIQQRGLQNEPGGGRITLGREAARRYNRIRQRCHEVVALEERIRDWLDRAHIP